MARKRHAATNRLLVFGAHPDDCEAAAGGLAALYVRAGHVVRFVSMTNGDTGHYEMSGAELARRRYAEAQRSAAILGIEYTILDNHNGELEAVLERRKEVIRIIRTFKPDLVLTHGPDDYHPDHRYTSVLVQDSAYQVTVPGMCALTPHLMRNPIYGYVRGSAGRSPTFSPTVVVDIGQVIEKKLAMLACHESQFLEWIPYSRGQLKEVPTGKAARRRWIENMWRPSFAGLADKCREQLIARYGKSRGSKVKFAEAVEISPFGSALTEEAARRLFPF